MSKKNLWIWFEKKDQPRFCIIIPSDTGHQLTESEFKRRIKRNLNIGKTRLPKHSFHKKLNSVEILEESPRSNRVSNRAVPEKSKQIPFQPTKPASSSSVESRRQERKKYQDNDNKLKSKIGTLQSLVNDLKNENAVLKKINGELDAVNKGNNSKLKQIDKFQANEQRAIQDLNSLCSTFIDTCIKAMSIDKKRDIDILSKRLQNTNSLKVFFQTLSRICLGEHIKRDRVDGGEWFKIRHDQKGHFGDDGRVRLFYHPSSQKIAVFYKSDEKKGKRFERNLPNLESRSKG